MCGYQFPKTGKYCLRRDEFWVQSLLSTHNNTACAQHLARTVREIDKCAREHEITSPTRKDDVHPCYVKDGKPHHLTRAESNYARVTVKPL